MAGGRPALRARAGLERRRRGTRPWPIEIDGVTLELRPTDAGQVGLFPEHAAMLPWLRRQVAARNEVGEAPAVLHLFAYTGLVTLAMAAAGARVTHVDAARPTVGWARHNAALSGLADRPIRWIVDDATAFTGREVRRGRRYAGVVLDPPSYGHGPGAGAWRIGDDLAPLLEAIAGLLVPDGFLLLTAHTPELGAGAAGWGRRPAALGRPIASIEAGDLELDDARRPARRARRIRPVVRRGMMTAMRSPTPTILTSLANPRIRAAAALRDRRERDRTGLTLIDGAREIRRAIDAGADLVEVFVCEPLLAGPDARAALDGCACGTAASSVHATSEPVFAKLAFGERSEGLVAVARIPSLELDALVLPDDPLVAVVEGVEKPGNLGAILRSADGAGRRRGRRGLATDGPVQSRTRSGPAPGRSSPSRWPPLRPRTCSPGSATGACGSSPRGSTPPSATPTST